MAIFLMVIWRNSPLCHFLQLYIFGNKIDAKDDKDNNPKKIETILVREEFIHRVPYFYIKKLPI